MAAKVFLVFLALFLIWFFFNRPGNPLSLLSFKFSNAVVAITFAVLRALLFGAFVYFLFVLFGHVSRISTFSDILTVLTARPSQLGASAFYGEIFGVIVVIYVFFLQAPRNRGAGSSSGMIRGRNVMVDPYLPKRITLGQRIRFFLARLFR